MPGGVVDTDTRKELARLTIEFEGTSVYIPLDDNTADRLMAKGFAFFRLDAFVMNEDMRIPMKIAEAIGLGILDTKTVQDIREFPTVCSDPHWTFWHQLKHFFAHYTRDADAPIRWNGRELHFRVPPGLHPSAKRLLVVSSTFSEGIYARRSQMRKSKFFASNRLAATVGIRSFRFAHASIHERRF